MKKFISAVLSLVMAISMMSTAVMAEEEAATVTSTEVTEEVTEINSAEAVDEETEEEVTEEDVATEDDAAIENQEENARIYEQMLEEIALVSALGVNVDTNKLNQNIERHEFASMLLSLLDKDGVGGANVTFHDVTPENSYYDDVMSAALFGVLHGDGVGYVNPERYLDFNEAMKMAVVALDMQYQNYADALGGYPDGYRTLAESLGLTKKISQRAGSVSYATAIKILYNMMYSNYYKVAIIQNHCVLEETDETNLEHYYGLTKYDGIVTNTPYTLSILGNDKTNAIEIDGVVYTMELGTEFDANDALGKSVFYYLDEEEVVRVIVPKANKNYVLEIPARDIIPENPVPANPTSIRYYPDGQDKAKKASFSKPIFFYNGRRTTEMDPGDLYPEDGKVTLIDNDGDGSYDYVIIESYKQYVTLSSSFGKIVSKYDDWSIMIEEDSNIRLYRDGIQITSAFVGEWDSLKVMLPKSGNGGIINVSGKEITGTIEKIITDDYGDKVAVIEGKEYKIGKVYLDAIANGVPGMREIKAGYSAVLALDDENTIIGVKNVRDGAGEYGYLVKIYGGDSGTQAKIFTTRGNMIRIGIADKVKIGDEKYNVADGSVDSLAGILIDAETGATYDQLVKYKMNSKNLISEIIIAQDKTLQGYVTNETFSLCYQWQGLGSFPHRTETYCIGHDENYRISLNDKVPVIYVPHDRSSDDEYYAWDGYADWMKYRRDVDIKIYDAKRMSPNYELNNIGAMVAYIRESDRPNTEHSFTLENFGGTDKYIVMDVNTSIDEDGELVYLVDVLKDRHQMETVIFDDNAYNIDVTNLFGGADKRPEDLQRGDMINILYDNEKKVDRRVIGYAVFTNAEWYGDPEKVRMYTDNVEDPDKIIQGRYLITYGELVYSSGEEFIVKTKTKSGKTIYIPFVSGMQSGNVYSYDTHDKTIVRGTKDQLVTGARVVCSGSYITNFGTVIVIND